jgi:hypothetical protein
MEFFEEEEEQIYWNTGTFINCVAIPAYAVPYNSFIYLHKHLTINLPLPLVVHTVM